MTPPPSQAPPRCPRGKALYRAVSRGGAATYRQSARSYTHAVEWCSAQGAWTVISFHGSEAAALRSAQQSWIARHRGAVVPVEIVEDRRDHGRTE